MTKLTVIVLFVMYKSESMLTDSNKSVGRSQAAAGRRIKTRCVGGS